MPKNPITSAALVHLRAAVHHSKLAEQEVADAVHRAREAGASWSEVGECLGVSKQAAHERWGTR